MALVNINDTIVAISTPLGTGGVGVIRISGENAFDVVSKIFTSKPNFNVIPDFKANKIYHGWIIEENKLIDEVILLSFKAPRSYTGENTIEIQCHGGINIVKNILNLCILAGARLADKGEFTKRAFLNGKLDLSKAEAVLDLIHSKTDKFSHLSAGNLAGKLSIFIQELRIELVDLLTKIIAAIDFPEDVEEPDYLVIEEKIISLINSIDKILISANSSNLMRQGVKVAVAGKPNVGKSSLFNSLLELERSIVTNIPGTTRDIIQESIDIKGIPVTLIDTAGIRELNTNDENDYVESIGIDIAKNCIQESSLVLFIFDLTQGMTKEDEKIYSQIKHKQHIKIGSKCDLVTDFNIEDKNSIVISSKTGFGIQKVKDYIAKNLLSEDIMSNSEFSTNTRQQECLVRAKDALSKALESTKNYELQDFISIDLKSALISLGEITGEIISDEILNNIFANFCLGK